MVGLALFLLLVFVSYASNWFNLASAFTQSGFFNYLLNHQGIEYIGVVLIVIPIIGAFISLFFGEHKSRARDMSVIYMGFLNLVLVVFLYPFVLESEIELLIPKAFFLGLSLRIDMLAYVVLLLSAYIWFFVMIYAHEYMSREKKITRFFFFLGITYSSVIGAIISGDLLMMFIFFEIMTVASYILVIHGQNEESYKAGYNYIIMGLIGGFLIIISVLFISKIHTFNSSVEAIIMSPEVYVRSSPIGSGTDLFAVHSGLKVRIENQSSDWYKVRLPDGKEGWIERTHLEII